MIILNGNPYRLCLLDTNAISEMVKNPKREFANFQNWALREKPTYISAISPFSILELRQRRDVYNKFLEIFSIWPCAIVKGDSQLIEEELSQYPDPSPIIPIAFNCVGILQSPEQRLDKVLDLVFNPINNQIFEQKWIEGRQKSVDDIASFVKYYPPENGKYTSLEIRTFLFATVVQHIYFKNRPFLEKLQKENNGIEIDAFPSIKMMLYTLFYKFYVDKRKYEPGDALDIIISSSTPYMDAIVTERHQAEVIKKIKTQDKFIEKVKVLRIPDIRDPI
jgi:hypothetical protein